MCLSLAWHPWSVTWTQLCCTWRAWATGRYEYDVDFSPAHRQPVACLDDSRRPLNRPQRPSAASYHADLVHGTSWPLGPHLARTSPPADPATCLDPASHWPSSSSSFFPEKQDGGYRPRSPFRRLPPLVARPAGELLEEAFLPGETGGKLLEAFAAANEGGERLRLRRRRCWGRWLLVRWAPLGTSCNTPSDALGVSVILAESSASFVLGLLL
jgi:hypothetical protein